MATGIRTISCKQAAGLHQTQHIDATLKAFAEACNYIAEWGRQHQVSAQFKLHKGTYYDVREHFVLAIGPWQRQ